MLRKISFLLFLCLIVSNLSAQDDDRIKIVEEKVANRLGLYALNVSDVDLDVMITVEGTDFRQSKGRPRVMRVPAISKVHLKNLILVKGKEPKYTYQLEVNDSLSRRALKRPYEKIKIDPKKSITVYITEVCKTCDTLVGSLAASKYNFFPIKLAERPEIMEQLKRILPEIETFENPIISLAGRIDPKVKTYDQLIEALNKEEEE